MHERVELSLREKCPYLEFFWSVSSRIGTQYSVRINPNEGKNGKTPYKGTFKVVYVYLALRKIASNSRIAR